MLVFTQIPDSCWLILKNCANLCDIPSLQNAYGSYLCTYFILLYVLSLDDLKLSSVQLRPSLVSFSCFGAVTSGVCCSVCWTIVKKRSSGANACMVLIPDSNLGIYLSLIQDHRPPTSRQTSQALPYSTTFDIASHITLTIQDSTYCVAV